MANLPDYKDIIGLIRKGATLEAQERIMELRSAVIDLKEEASALRNRVLELEAALDTKSRMSFRKHLYWMPDDPIPFCPQCWEDKRKLMHLQGGARGQRFRCALCDFMDVNND